MTTKSPLQVKPLRRYIKPRYPSYNDPNPLAHPYARPYPFSKRFVQWALASGLVGASAFSANAQQTNPEPPLKNPFTLRSLGLPYRPVMFGTGLPERLKEKDVREAAARAFAAEGIKLDTSFLWRQDTQELLLDGYDTVSHIGYVVLPYYKLGPGTDLEDGLRYYDQPKDVSWIERHKAYFRTMKSSKEARKTLQEYLQFMDPARVPESRRSLYQALVDQLHDNINATVETETFINMMLDGTFHRVRESYLPELEAIVERTIATNRKSIRQNGLKRIQILEDHQLLREQRSESDPYMLEFNEIYNLINKVAFELSGSRPNLATRDRWELLARIQRTVANINGTQEGTEFMQKLKSAIEHGTKWNVLESFDHYINQIQASMDEIEALTMEAESGKRFVAMIDWFGPHTEMRRGVVAQSDLPMNPQMRPDWKDLDKETRSRLIREREIAYNAAFKKSNEQAEELSIQRLEKEIRQFIQWARQEGKY